mmetsp:Transcript_110106/g.290574  ORF Transcript_110106/g.290574 Transcript_110106/m.290574 type:complete len:203 (-) Transcript_110106:687-1295(-)
MAPGRDLLRRVSAVVGPEGHGAPRGRHAVIRVVRAGRDLVPHDPPHPQHLVRPRPLPAGGPADALRRRCHLGLRRPGGRPGVGLVLPVRPAGSGPTALRRSAPRRRLLRGGLRREAERVDGGPPEHGAEGLLAGAAGCLGLCGRHRRPRRHGWAGRDDGAAAWASGVLWRVAGYHDWWHLRIGPSFLRGSLQLLEPLAENGR